jgi:hypothetical protein
MRHRLGGATRPMRHRLGAVRERLYGIYDIWYIRPGPSGDDSCWHEHTLEPHPQVSNPTAVDKGLYPEQRRYIIPEITKRC